MAEFMNDVEVRESIPANAGYLDGPVEDVISCLTELLREAGRRGLRDVRMFVDICQKYGEYEHYLSVSGTRPATPEELSTRQNEAVTRERLTAERLELQYENLRKLLGKDK